MNCMIVFVAVVFMFANCCVLIKNLREKNKEIKKLMDHSTKMYEFYQLLLRWVDMKNEGKKIEDYFKRNSYKVVAIYGMREVGEVLLNELNNSSITVKYAIDQNADDIYVPIDIYKPENELESVDAVIVTAVHYFEDIEKQLSEKLNCPIISIEDIVWEA